MSHVTRRNTSWNVNASRFAGVVESSNTYKTLGLSLITEQLSHDCIISHISYVTHEWVTSHIWMSHVSHTSSRALYSCRVNISPPCILVIFHFLRAYVIWLYANNCETNWNTIWKLKRGKNADHLDDITLSPEWNANVITCIIWWFDITFGSITFPFWQKQKKERGIIWMKWESAEFLIASNWPISWSRCSVWHACLVHMCDMTRLHVCRASFIWQVSFICLTCRCLSAGAACDMTHLYVGHDSSIRVTCIIHMCDVPISFSRCCVWHDLLICVTWLIHVCDMTRPYVWHVSFICVTWRYLGAVAVCDMTHLFVWYDSSIRVTCVIHMCDYGVAATSRLLKIKGLFCKRDLHNRRYFAKETYNFKEPPNRSHPICQRLLIHLRYAVCTQRERKYRLFYRALLQKRPIILRSLLIIATP